MNNEDIKQSESKKESLEYASEEKQNLNESLENSSSESNEGEWVEAGVDKGKNKKR